MCGEARYEIHGPIRDFTACHCEQCRRDSGHYYQLGGDGVPTFTSAQWRTRQGWDPLSWSDGENHVEGARKFDEYERPGQT